MLPRLHFTRQQQKLLSVVCTSCSMVPRVRRISNQQMSDPCAKHWLSSLSPSPSSLQFLPWTSLSNAGVANSELSELLLSSLPSSLHYTFPLSPMSRQTYSLYVVVTLRALPSNFHIKGERETSTLYLVVVCVQSVSFLINLVDLLLHFRREGVQIAFAWGVVCVVTDTTTTATIFNPRGMRRRRVMPL